MAIQTRRHRPRIHLNEAAHLNFLAGNRAVIVDVSEGGLRFKTSSPLTSGDFSQYRFAFSGGGEMLADLAWTDESRTTGGLKFRSVSPEVRRQTRVWFEQSWRTSRGPGGLEPATVAAFSGTTARPATAIFTEIQSVGQSKRKTAASSFESVGTKPASLENRLSVFQRDATFTRRDFAGPAHASHGKRRLAIATLVVLFFLGAATAAAGYFDPGGTRDVMARAHEIAVQFATRIHNLPMPKLNQQRNGGATVGGA